jgi:hypothetical protein
MGDRSAEHLSTHSTKVSNKHHERNSATQLRNAQPLASAYKQPNDYLKTPGPNFSSMRIPSYIIQIRGHPHAKNCNFTLRKYIITYMNTTTVINKFTYSPTLYLVPHLACFCGENRNSRAGWRSRTHCKDLWIRGPPGITPRPLGVHGAKVVNHCSKARFQVLTAASMKFSLLGCRAVKWR